MQNLHTAVAARRWRALRHFVAPSAIRLTRDYWRPYSAARASPLRRLIMGAGVRFVGVVSLIVASVGCGGTDSGTVDKWMGSVRHLRIVGTIMGEKIDINIAAPDAN